MSPRDVVITGIGLVSSLGEGNEAHWSKLTTAPSQPIVDAARFAPYAVHPLPQIDWGLQIPKRGDQRQMETWQRVGTYGAGLALQDAGIKVPLEKWTQNVNDGKVSTEEYFLMKNLCAKIDELVAAKATV